MSAKTKPQPETKAKLTPLTVSRKTAADLLGVDVQTIDRAIANKRLRASKIGRRVIVRYDAIIKMLDDNPA